MIITLWCGIGAWHSGSSIFSCNHQGWWDWLVTCTGLDSAVSQHTALGTFSPIVSQSTCSGSWHTWSGTSCSSLTWNCEHGPCWPATTPCLGICLVLAIYNTNSCLLVNHPSAHCPTQLPNRIHTASSFFALSTCFSLGCSISWTTNFQLLQISLDTLVHGNGYLILTPVDYMTPILGGYSLALILILTMLE